MAGSDTSIDHDEWRRRLQELEAALNEHPGVIAWDEWYAFRQTYEAVWQRNLADLIHLLREPTRDPKLAMELMQNVKLPEVRERFYGEVARRLHNYASSSTTLVDHSRRLVRRYEGSSFHSEYEARKDIVAASPETQFVKGLRNFILHRRLPAAGNTLSFQRDGNSGMSVNAEIHLSVAQLLTWDGWSSNARAFLEDAGQDLALIPVVKRHGEVVSALVTWMMAQFGPLHREELAEANKLITAHNEHLMGPGAGQPAIVVQLDPDQAAPGEIVVEDARFRQGR